MRFSSIVDGAISFKQFFVTAYSRAPDEGETNDFVLQAPDNMYNDEPFNPVTSR